MTKSKIPTGKASSVLRSGLKKHIMIIYFLLVRAAAKKSFFNGLNPLPSNLMAVGTSPLEKKGYIFLNGTVFTAIKKITFFAASLREAAKKFFS